MATDRQFSQSFRSFARRENIPATLTSDDWEQVPSEIRERAFFMAQVTDGEILQKFRDEANSVLREEYGEDTAEKNISMWLEDQGYKPPVGKEGTLQDLSSLDRVNLVLRMNISMSRNHATWARQQETLDTFPAQRLARVSQREEPRDWLARWREAMQDLGESTQAVAIGEGGDLDSVLCAAPVNDPIWRMISRFDIPFPPYDFNSGVGTRLLNSRETREAGIVIDPDSPVMQPQIKSLNEELQATPQISDPILRQALDDKLGRFGEWDGEKMIFTDPDGTKRYTADRLAEIWKRPAPEGYDRLDQKDALDRWDGGVTEDAQDDRVTLRRLFDRIDTPEQPAELHRAFVLSPDQAPALIRSLTSRRLMIPPSVAGWDWTRTQQAAIDMLGNVGRGWRVLIRAVNVKRAVDVQSLRPGKPGFVIVGGKVLRVSDMVQDVGSRTITITLNDGD